MKDQEILEAIVSEILSRLETYETKRKPELLVFYQHSKCCSEEIELLKIHWNLKRVTDSSKVPTIEKQVVFLDVTQDLLVKAALGITDTEECLLFSRLLLQNCKVTLVPHHSLSWILKPNEGSIGNQKYIEKLLQYKVQLQSYDVHFLDIKAVTPKNICHASKAINNVPINNSKKMLITKEFIEGWQENSLNIGLNTIITPLARDIAKEKGIKIYMNDV